MKHSALFWGERMRIGSGDELENTLTSPAIHREAAMPSDSFNRKPETTVDGLATNRASPSFAPQAATRDAKSGEQGSTNHHPFCSCRSRGRVFEPLKPVDLIIDPRIHESEDQVTFLDHLIARWVAYSALNMAAGVYQHGIRIKSLYW